MTETTTTITATGMRRCVGSRTFGIEAHEAPFDDFPIQPSRRDGLGVMCKPHWTKYTSALRKAALARKAAPDGIPAQPAEAPAQPAEAPAESPGPKARRAKLEAKLAEVGVGTDEGQRILEAAAALEGIRPGPVMRRLGDAG
ncbi:MAG TPA: hypothetical protein VLM76_00880 [Patescibacteria group bacterium]|nr:hypothetical protein [Patescibacteria group bacterium]